MENSSIVRIEDLNEDCLLEIIKYSGLKEQIALALVCPRFNDILAYVWQAKFCTFEMSFYEIDLNDGEFDRLIGNICSTVEVVKLKFLSCNKFAILKKYTFPRVHDLRFSQMDQYYMKDEDILKLHAVFPNIKTFSPQGAFSGKYMSNWTGLENLTLSHCKKFDVKYFIELLGATELKTINLNIFHDIGEGLERNIVNLFKLEKILLNSAELKWLMVEAFIHLKCLNSPDYETYFKNLKEVVLTDIGNEKTLKAIFFLLCRFKAADVVGLEMRDFIMEVTSFTNLQKLSFTRNSTALLEMPGNVTVLTQLRELNFYSCDIYMEEHISTLLRSSGQVEVINFEECTMMFSELHVNVHDVVKARTKPLKLNFYNNYMNEDILVQLIVNGESALFSITNEKTVDINYEPIKIIFQ